MSLAVLPFVLATACAGSGEDPLQIGIKRSAIDLAFKDESIAPKPPEVRVVVTDLPAPELTSFEAPPLPRRPVPAFTPPVLCPKAAPDAVPEQAVSVNITKPPVEGRYTYLAKGSIRIQVVGLFNITLPMLPFLQRDVMNVKEVFTKSATGADTTTKAWQYDVVTRLGNTSIRQTFQVRAAELMLVGWERKSQAQTLKLDYNPPIEIYEYGAEDNDWQSAGFDRATNTAAVFEGRIAKRDLLDVCGTLIDTYRATSQEIVQSPNPPLGNGYNYQTKRDDATTSDKDESDPNVYNIATHLGPLFVKEHIHTTEVVAVVTDSGDVQQATIEWNYDTQIMSMTPQPIPASAR